MCAFLLPVCFVYSVHSHPCFRKIYICFRSCHDVSTEYFFFFNTKKSLSPILILFLGYLSEDAIKKFQSIFTFSFIRSSFYAQVELRQIPTTQFSDRYITVRRRIFLNIYFFKIVHFSKFSFCE